MPDPQAVLLERFKEHKVQARQHETLRASLVTFTAAAAGAVLSFAGGNTTDVSFKIAASLFLVILGVFSAYMAYKHYERFRYHSRFAKAYDKKLSELLPGQVNLEDYSDIKAAHRKKFGWIVEGRAYIGWIAFPLLISLLGASLLALQLKTLLAHSVNPTPPSREIPAAGPSPRTLKP